MTERHAPRVVVITGGTAGVGRATARRFAEEHARIAVLARGPDGLAATEGELERLGASAVLAIRCDVADAEAVAAAADRIERELGEIDVWINNAMTTVFGRFESVTPREYERVTAVTYLGYVWGTRAALSRMVPRDRGLIIQVGSALSHRSIPLQAAYCGAKHAIRGFTDSIRSELIHAHSRVRLTMIQAPAVNTPQFRWCQNHMPCEPQPVPPIFQPELIADAIYYASIHERREIDLGMTTVAAVLGQMVAPGFLDHYLARRGYDGQMTDRPNVPGRPTNLFAPVPGDHGAHGAFDAHARGSDPTLRITRWLGAAGVTVLAGLASAAALLGLARVVVRRRSPA